MQDSLLSRFDLLFIVLDQVSQAQACIQCHCTQTPAKGISHEQTSLSFCGICRKRHKNVAIIKYNYIFCCASLAVLDIFLQHYIKTSLMLYTRSLVLV